VNAMDTLVESIDGLRQRLTPVRGQAVIGVVPTMGALHAGHLRLIEQARRECGFVIVTIFVNPLQFDREDDLRKYPRTLEADLEICNRAGADVVFAPQSAEVYPRPPLCTVAVTRLADHLCGRHRPGHFQGVATIVLKLLQMAEPDRAYFGEKDAQQLAIIRRLVADFNVPVTIIGVPTVRESDGLALSSRNRLLSKGERALAPALHAALVDVERQIASGARDSGAILAAAASRVPSDPSLRLEYLEIVDPVELQPVSLIAGPVLAAGALWVGSTRLIDNVFCTLPEEKVQS
jgi:pantoate--beta-alanine ligase